MEDWSKWFQKAKHKFTLLNSVVSLPDYLCWPSKDKMFKAFKLCPLDKVRIVMIGELPYTHDNKATGLLFANPKGTEALSGSLSVIKEAVIDYTTPHGIIDFDITLESWAKQGILLLNYPLMVTYNKRNLKHDKELWFPFMIEVLKLLREYSNGLIYVLFGYAKELAKHIDVNNNYLITGESPVMYSKTNKRMGHDVFRRIDYYLNKQYGEKIKWYEER